MVQKVVKYLQAYRYGQASIASSLPDKKSGFEEYPVVPAAGIHKDLTILGTTMNIHIPHKDTMTLHN